MNNDSFVTVLGLALLVFLAVWLLSLAGCGAESHSQDTYTINCAQTITVDMPEARANELAAEAEAAEQPFDVVAFNDAANGDVTVTATMCTEFWSEHNVSTSQDTETTAVTTTGTVSVAGQ